MTYQIVMSAAGAAPVHGDRAVGPVAILRHRRILAARASVSTIHMALTIAFVIFLSCTST
jgi:hypothetical protein